MQKGVLNSEMFECDARVQTFLRNVAKARAKESRAFSPSYYYITSGSVMYIKIDPAISIAVIGLAKRI